MTACRQLRPCGPPWAIAPINEVEKVLDYAVTAMPRNKIMMGVPTYGRDWKLPYVKGQSVAQTFDPKAAVHRAANYGVSIQYNPVYQAPYYHYTDASGARHEVWSEDARSFQAKCNLVKQYNLRGMSFWQWPSTFPQAWSVLSANFNVRKIS